MKKESTSRSRGTLILSAVCWTIVTVLWIITASLLFDPHSSLSYLQIAAFLLSLVNAILNWCRLARSNKNND